MTSKKISVPTEDKSRTQRVAQFIAQHEGISVRLANSWCQDGKVKDARTQNSLKKGDLVPTEGILILKGEPSESAAPTELNIQFEDKNILVLNKPAGLPTLAKNLSDTQSDCIARRLQERFKWAKHLQHQDSGLCHRLDNDTSGLLVVAKTRQQQESLRRQWQGIQKGYLTLVEGQIDTVQHITLPMAHHKTAKQKMVTVQAQELGRGPSRRAETLFFPLAHANGCTLLAAFLKSRGNRHQIRVHAQSMSTPLIGDVLYGGPANDHLPGQALHAALLIIPGQEPLYAPCPHDFIQTALHRGFNAADFAPIFEHLMGFSRK